MLGPTPSASRAWSQTLRARSSTLSSLAPRCHHPHAHRSASTRYLSASPFSTHSTPCPPPPALPLLSFDGDKLVQTDGSPFAWQGQLHYDALGDFVLHHIQQTMTTGLGLVEVALPLDAAEGEATTSIWVSPTLKDAEKIMVLLQGSGAVRPGLWARSVVLNDSLGIGAQLRFIERAQREGFAVAVLNPNENKAEVALEDTVGRWATCTAAEFEAGKRAAPAGEEGKEGVQDDPMEGEGGGDGGGKGEESGEDEGGAAGGEDAAASEGASASEGTVSSAGEGEGADAAAAVAAVGAEGKDACEGTEVAGEEAGDAAATAVAVKRVKPVKVRGSENPQAHVVYVWDEILSKTSAPGIALVAHSAGGAGTTALLRERTDAVLARLRGVAFTDAVHWFNEDDPEAMLSFLGKHAIDWVASTDPLDTPQDPGDGFDGAAKDPIRCLSAGHKKHEYTTGCAEESVFGFLLSYFQ